MALVFGPPPPPRFPSGRYTQTNPLRREYGLRLLTGSLPEPLRTRLIRAWRRPASFDGKETLLALQSARRPHPTERQLAQATLQMTRALTLTELEVSRRLVEAPIASISRTTRHTLLEAQGAYLRQLYNALVVHLGSAEAALAEFGRLSLSVG